MFWFCKNILWEVPKYKKTAKKQTILLLINFFLDRNRLTKTLFPQSSLVQCLQKDQLILILPIVLWISFEEFLFLLFVGIKMLPRSIVFISIFGHTLCAKQYFLFILCCQSLILTGLCLYYVCTNCQCIVREQQKEF